MSTVFRYLGMALLSLVLIAATGVAALLFLIDPNIFRADIEALAADQGVILKLEGDLSWKVFPAVEVELGKASLALLDAEESLARFDNAQLAVALMPLLRKQIVVKGVALDGLDLKLSVDEAGVSNWSQLAGDQAARHGAVADQNEAATALPPLSIAALQLSNASIRYDDHQSGQQLVLSGLSLSSRGVQLTGTAFPLSLAAKVAFQDAAQSLKADVALQSSLAVDETFEHVDINGGDLEMTLAHHAGAADLEVSSHLKINAQLSFGEVLAWTLSELQLSDTRLQYHAKGGPAVEIAKLDIQGGLAPGHEASALRLSSELEYIAPAAAPLRFGLDLSLQVGVDSSLSAWEVKDLELAAKLNGQPLRLSGEGSAELAPLGYQGKLHLAPAQLRKLLESLAVSLPEMSAADALGTIALDTGFRGSDKVLKIEGLKLQLDKSLLTADASVDLGGSATSRMEARLDTLNLDRYLPAATPESAGDSTASAAGGSNTDELPIPRELLNSLNLDASLSVGELQFRRLSFKAVNLKIVAKNGLSRIAPLAGNINDGTFNLEAQLDSRAENPKYQLKGGGARLPLGQLLKELADNETLSGRGNLAMDLQTQGNSVTSVKQNLTGQIDIDARQLRLTSMNIERAFCQLVNRLQNEPFSPADWPAYSDLLDTKTRISFTRGVARIEQLHGGVSKLAISGKGKVDLVENAFDVVIDSRLTQADQNALKCKIQNEKLLDRDIPIRCKASFDGIDATSCLPDFRVIEDIAKDKARAKADKKVQEVFQRKLGNENGEAAKQIFDQWFKK